MTDTTSPKARAFRFGIVAPVLPNLPTWREQVRRIADHGYSTVLMPDFPRLQPAPAAALAVAATLADVRVGTWVYAAAFACAVAHRVGGALADGVDGGSLRDGNRGRPARHRGRAA
ncbi:MAG: hypothetical protein WCG47_06890 [Dermatophilaceae bacterium]